MSKYLADTDILIDHIRGHKYITPQIINEGLSLCIISLAELLYGAYKSVNPKKSLEKIDQLLSLGVEVENLDPKIVSLYAQQKVNLEKSGQKLDEFDLLIASTAKIKDLILLTRNLSHFKRIPGLRLVS